MTCFPPLRRKGLESKEKGKFTRDELAPLAKVNVESLKEFDYFTFAMADGKKAELTDPAPGYWLDYKDQVLTLNFLLPFKNAGEGQRAEESKSTILPFSSTSRSPRTSRCNSRARRNASSTWCCRAK